VTADGSVDWLCFPRFDSPSIFGRLLDDAAGHWSIRPAGAYTASRRYLDRTLVLETSFRTQGGTVVVTDAPFRLTASPVAWSSAAGKGHPRFAGAPRVGGKAAAADLEVGAGASALVSARGPQRSQAGSNLGRVDLRLLPGREVAALGSLVEVDELVVRPFRPAARRLVDLGREDGHESPPAAANLP
jgi:hypothetical protein